MTTSFHCRWVWSQLNRFAAIGIKGHAAGIVIVYDLSPGMAFGLAQRSVYTENGRAGLGATYINCPTLTLDRVNGAKVLADAKAGKMATLTLRARFQRDTGKAIIAYLPGKNYGTPQDEQVLLATHTDAMSLIEENGGLGMLGIMSYFNRVPKGERARTLVFYFDCRHFMPGGEASWPQFDYYNIHPETAEDDRRDDRHGAHGRAPDDRDGPGGNTYAYSPRASGRRRRHHEPDGRLQQQHLAGRNDRARGHRQSLAARGRQVGRERRARRQRRIPGRGQESDEQGPRLQDSGHRPRRRLAGRLDADLRAGGHRSRAARLRRELLRAQVAGLSQIAGEFMQVKPIVIDLGWGELKTAVMALKDPAALAQYVDVFRKVETGKYDQARSGLKDLAEKHAALNKLIDAQLAKLS